MAKPLRLALGACLIQSEYGYSDEEVRLQIQEGPYLRPIVRGKVKAKVEFGAKLDISVVDGYTRLETLSFDAYNEATFLKDVTAPYFRRVLLKIRR